MCVSVCVLGRGVENEEGREGILVRIDVEGSGEKNAKNEIDYFFSFAFWSFNYFFSCAFIHLFKFLFSFINNILDHN